MHWRPTPRTAAAARRSTARGSRCSSRRFTRGCRGSCRSSGSRPRSGAAADAGDERVRGGRASSRSTAISRRRCRSSCSRRCSRARSATTRSTTRASPSCGSGGRPTRAGPSRRWRRSTRSATSSKRRRCAKPRPPKRSAIRRPRSRSTSGSRRAKTTAPDDVLMRLGRCGAGDRQHGEGDRGVLARRLRVPVQRPGADRELGARDAADRRRSRPARTATSWSSDAPSGCSARRRYAEARDRVRRPAPAAQGDDRELVELRLAECDYFLKRARAARDGVRPFIEKASRQGEALFFYAVASRELGDHAEYLRVVRRLVSEFPTQSWAEEALNNLATHYILQNDDESADEAFRELYEKFPGGRYAERAAWKIGWWAYRNGRYAETVRVFESAAAHFPRSDYRPSWLYWSGRAHEALKEPALRRRALHAGRDRLPEQLLRPAGARAARGQGAAARSPSIAVDAGGPPRARATAGRRRCRRTSRSFARCSRSTSTIRRSTSCATRRRCGATRRRFRRRIAWIHQQQRGRPAPPASTR